MNEKRVFRPRRRLKSEIIPLFSIIALAAALIASFPFEATAIRAKGALRPLKRGACAWVTLSPKAMRRQLAAARAAWQVDALKTKALRSDLLDLGDIPDERLELVALSERTRFRRGNDAAYRIDVVDHGLSAAASAPERLAPSAEAEAVFSRAELLAL